MPPFSNSQLQLCRVKPLFSIILPMWNRRDRVTAAVDSVLAQTCQDFELIVADDGSTDGSVELLRQRYAREIANGKMCVVRGGHVGVSAARNRALAVAKGEWIAYIDSDNTIHPDFLARFDAAIKAHPEARTFNAKFRFRIKGEERGRAYERNALVERNFIDMGVFVHRRSLFEEFGGFDETMKRLVDWDLVLRYTAKHPPAFVDAVVMDYDDEKRQDRITASRESFLAWRQVIWNRYAADLPLVSTVVTCHNHEKYLREALDSTLRQEGKFRHEILISDDGSTDGTPGIVAEYAEKFPQLVRNISSTINLGISGNLKKCLAAARGDCIAILEGDDYWNRKDKLETQLEFLRRHAEAPMVFSRTLVFDEKAGHSRFLKIQENLPELMSGRDFFNAGSSSVIVNFSACMFRKTALENLPDVLFENRLSEIALAFYLERRGPVGYISTPMSVYRQHADSTFTGDDFIGRRQQEIACRETAIKVCDPRYVPDFRREISRIDEVIARRMERSSRKRFVRTGHWLRDVIHGAIQCYHDNGLMYTIRRILFGRQY